MTLEPGRDSPSSKNVGDRSIVRLYIQNQHDPEIYENVKHCWIDSSGLILMILHYYENQTYRYVYWPLSNIRWWQIMPQKIEETHG